MDWYYPVLVGALAEPSPPGGAWPRAGTASCYDGRLRASAAWPTALGDHGRDLRVRTGPPAGGRPERGPAAVRRRRDAARSGQRALLDRTGVPRGGQLPRRRALHLLGRGRGAVRRRAAGASPASGLFTGDSLSPSTMRLLLAATCPSPRGSETGRAGRAGRPADQPSRCGPRPRTLRSAPWPTCCAPAPPARGGCASCWRGDGPVLAPGAYDALSARLVEQAGFDVRLHDRLRHGRLAARPAGRRAGHRSRDARQRPAHGGRRRRARRSPTPTPATAARSTWCAPCRTTSGPAWPASTSRTRCMPKRCGHLSRQGGRPHRGDGGPGGAPRWRPAPTPTSC